MLHRAEVVGNAMFAAVAHEQHVHVPQLAVAVRAAQGSGVDVRGLGEFPRLPPGTADHPGNDVLETAEDGTPVAGWLVGAKAVTGLDGLPAPGAPIAGHGLATKSG